MEKLGKEFSEHNKHLSDYWLSSNLWTWRWWLVIILSVVPWAVWLLIRKKESTWRLMSAGFFAFIVTVFLDVIGISLGLRFYPVRLAPLPLICCVFPWDFSILPVAIMLFLQFQPKMNPFVKAASFAFFGSFVLYPLAIWTGLVMEAWWLEFVYFPIFFILYLLSHVITSREYAKIIR